jgi:hypothetical protein
MLLSVQMPTQSKKRAKQTKQVSGEEGSDWERWGGRLTFVSAHDRGRNAIQRLVRRLTRGWTPVRCGSVGKGAGDAILGRLLNRRRTPMNEFGVPSHWRYPSETCLSCEGPGWSVGSERANKARTNCAQTTGWGLGACCRGMNFFCASPHKYTVLQFASQSILKSIGA